MIPALAILKVVPLWVYPAAAALMWVGCTVHDARQAKAKLEAAVAKSAEARAVESANSREVERKLVEGAGRVANELSKAQSNVSAVERGLAQRLRANAAAWAASTAGAGPTGACGSDVAPAIGIISGQTREDLVSFAKDAETVRQTLLACQKLVKEQEQVLNRVQP